MNVFNRGYQFYKDLPSWGKAVVVIGGGAITWFGIVNPVRKVIIKKLDESKYNKTIGEFRDDIRQLSQKGIKPNYSAAQYKAWADAIENTFAGCDPSIRIIDFSDSGAALYNIILQLKNDADFASLVTAFGSRTYDQCGIWPFSGDITADLHKAVNDELDANEIVGINNRLAIQKITYKF